MLTMKKVTVLNGESKIDDVVAERYSASINHDTPKSMAISCVQVDKDLAKANRATCREDRASFEDVAYAEQDRVIAALGTTEETE